MAANTLIQVRRGTASDWTTTNPTLASGEIGYETNTGKFKIGDGSVVWASLAYSAIKPSDLDALIGNYVGTNLVGGPGITVAASSGAADYIISLSDPTIQVSNITDLTASAAELNLLDGVTATTTELNYVDVTTAGTTSTGLVPTTNIGGTTGVATSAADQIDTTKVMTASSATKLASSAI